MKDSETQKIDTVADLKDKALADIQKEKAEYVTRVLRDKLNSKTKKESELRKKQDQITEIEKEISDLEAMSIEDAYEKVLPVPTFLYGETPYVIWTGTNSYC